jgi:acyl carrier protein
MRKDDGLTPVAATQAARAPRSLADTQKLLGEIFAQILSVPDVSLEDNFFDLGATSLLMVRARNEIKTQFGRELAMNDLFEHTSIADLARFMLGDEVETKVVAAQTRGARQNDLFQKLRKFAGKAPQ